MQPHEMSSQQQHALTGQHQISKDAQVEGTTSIQDKCIRTKENTSNEPNILDTHGTPAGAQNHKHQPNQTIKQAEHMH